MKIIITFLIFICLATNGEASVEVRGKVESVALKNKNQYRVTVYGFSRVLHADADGNSMKCLEASVKKGNEVKISTDLNGKILSCEK
jgi:hypothetical protein